MVELVEDFVLCCRAHQKTLDSKFVVRSLHFIYLLSGTKHCYYGLFIARFKIKLCAHFYCSIVMDYVDIGDLLGINILDDKPDRLHSPFLVNSPNSVEADKTGLSDGELITKYAKDAVLLIKLRYDLQSTVDLIIERVPETTISITHFTNWGGTQDSLLLHVKPSQTDQVVAIVQGVMNFNQTNRTQVL